MHDGSATFRPRDVPTMSAPPLRVERRAYDGELTAYWDARLLRRRSKLLVWHAPPLTPIIYPRRGFNTPLRRHELGWVWIDRRYTVAVELTEGSGPFGPDLAKMHALALKDARPAPS